jgi:hypothetical protein
MHHRARYNTSLLFVRQGTNTGPYSYTLNFLQLQWGYNKLIDLDLRNEWLPSYRCQTLERGYEYQIIERLRAT